MTELTRFLFEGLPVRGRLVRLDDQWQALLARRAPGHEHPPELRSLLGQMCAAGVLMQSGLSFDGALVLQIHGDGPVKLAVAEVQSDLGFRATATLTGAVPAGAGLQALLNVHGQGRCAITLDPRGRQPGRQAYQGVVPLHGDRREPLASLAAVLEHYMLQSEQLDTRLVLAADDHVAAGLLVQRVPLLGQSNLGGGHAPRDEDAIGQSEDFNRIALLAGTLTADELLNLSADALLHRLFWEEDLRRFEPLRPRFACTCSAERVRSMLQGLGRDESESLIRERGMVEVGCEFCGRQYRFDAVDVGALFTPPGEMPPAGEGVH